MRDICEFYTAEGHIVMIIGVLNADISRGNRFDNLLEAFVTQNNFLLLDRHPPDAGHFTYHKGNYTAFIDHCILANENKISD